MKNINTKYGVLQEIVSLEKYTDGSIKECILKAPCKLETPLGTLIPQYECSEERRKYVKSLSFFNNGNLESVYLQNQTEVNTPVGPLPAELITFYESGNIKRIFPLNGRLSAYWSEEEEYSLATDTELELSVGKIKEKIISLYFYESGAVKSITFWSKNKVEIQSPVGTVVTRVGLSFYENGKLSSFEPDKPTALQTPIGELTAFDTNIIGLHGDSNSVKFYEDGKLKALVSISNKIEVTDKNGKVKIFEPSLRPSVINDNVMEVIPLAIEFIDNKVRFNKNTSEEYTLSDNKFAVEYKPTQITSPCAGCAGCADGDGCC